MPLTEALLGWHCFSHRVPSSAKRFAGLHHQEVLYWIIYDDALEQTPTAPSTHTMPVFHVYLNGKRVSTAGVGELGVLGAHVSWVRRQGEAAELTLHVGGLIAPANEHVRWLDCNLKVGDDVSIRVVEKAPVDGPNSRERRDRSKELRAQKRYVKDMARKLGWKIQTK